MRILIAGLGAIGQRHARNIRALRADVELIAYRRRRLTHVVTESLTKDESRNVEQELGITAFDDLDDALRAKPDAAFICTSPTISAIFFNTIGFNCMVSPYLKYSV